MTLGPFAGKLGQTVGEDPIFFVEVPSLRRCCGAGACDSGRCGIRVARLGNQLHSLGGTKSKGPSGASSYELRSLSLSCDQNPSSA